MNIFYIEFNYMGRWWEETPWLQRGNFAVVVAEDKEKAMIVLSKTFPDTNFLDVEVEVLGKATAESESLVCGSMN